MKIITAFPGKRVGRNVFGKYHNSGKWPILLLVKKKKKEVADVQGLSLMDNQ